MGHTKIEYREAQAFFSYSGDLNFMQHSNEPSDIAISNFELQIFVKVIGFVGAIPRVFVLSTKKRLIWGESVRFYDDFTKW